MESVTRVQVQEKTISISLDANAFREGMSPSVLFLAIVK